MEGGQWIQRNVVCLQYARSGLPNIKLCAMLSKLGVTFSHPQLWVKPDFSGDIYHIQYTGMIRICIHTCIPNQIWDSYRFYDDLTPAAAGSFLSLWVMMNLGDIPTMTLVQSEIWRLHHGAWVWKRSTFNSSGWWIDDLLSPRTLQFWPMKGRPWQPV